MLKEIKRLKKKKLMEILLWVIVIAGTYMIWDFPSIAKTAAYYEENSLIQVIGDRDYASAIYGMSDEKALKTVEPYKLILHNSTYRYEKYKLYIGIDKNIEQESLKIAVDNEPILLRNLYSFTKDNCNYYLVDKNDLVAGNKEYYFKIWNEEEHKLQMNVVYKFYVEKI